MLRPALALLVSACLAVACGGPEPREGTPERASSPADPAAIWSFAKEAAGLRARSCPDGVSFARASGFEMTASPVELAPPALLADRLSGLEYAGGWHLTSEWNGFGGLSGLAVMRSGSLLAVSDQGDFVWIAMEDGAPAGSGNHAPMLDETGAEITGKRRQDGEGLALREGLALVSFEREHRILAFDLEGCGANARGARLVDVAERPSGMDRRMEPNGGLEGLALSPEGHLVAAAETPDAGVPLGAVTGGGAGAAQLALDRRLAAQAPLRATGLDYLGEDLLTVHRHYDRQSGNTIKLTRTPIGRGFAPEAGETLARLDTELTVDNFEAVAATQHGDGAARIYLLSDDNFNNSQRTLLLAFDLIE
mgnify:CR=1 FL=1